jgi:uncharacterized protein (DUF58 family)
VNGPVRAALLAGRRRPVVRGGSRPYPRHGDGFEIAELRAYVEGDDPRRIDWAATARAGALHVRLLLDEHALCFAAIVDDSPSMEVGRSRSLRLAAYEALDLWAEALGPEDRAIRVGSDDVAAPRLRGIAAGARLRERGEPGPFELAAALRLARAALPRDSALLVVSDFYADLDDDVLRDLGVHADCTALVARDPWFDGLPLRGFIRIRDAESGATRRIFLGRRERERYRAAVREREEQLLGRLSRNGWRTGVLQESDGAGALLDAFGLVRGAER